MCGAPRSVYHESVTLDASQQGWVESDGAHPVPHPSVSGRSYGLPRAPSRVCGQTLSATRTRTDRKTGHIPCGMVGARVRVFLSEDPDPARSAEVRAFGAD